MNLFKTLSFIFFFVCVGKIYSQVTVQTSNLKVNGSAVTNNTINFNGSPTVSVNIDITLKTFNGNNSNIFGNLYLFFKPNSSENEIQIGFSTVTFTVSYPPFVTQTTYTSQNYFNSVVLQASNFFASGGTFYVKYINNNNQSYSSANIQVIGGTRTSSNPPANQINSICCNQTIRYGDKPTVITGSNLNPTGISISWVNGSNTEVRNQLIPINFINTSVSNNNFDPDYLFETTVFKRKVAVNYSRTYSNPITITVVPSPIFSNDIVPGSFVLKSIGTQYNYEYEALDNESFDLGGLGARVNLNVLSNPFHTVLRSDTSIRIDSYKWQYKNSNADATWLDVPFGNTYGLTSFSWNSLPDFQYHSHFYFRRIAIYQNISRVSNIMKIVKRKSTTTNTICCDESVRGITNFIPSIIIGSTPIFNSIEAGVTNLNNPPLNISNPIYQWQVSSRSSEWVNIVGANSKDYLPPVEFYNYNVAKEFRRIVRFNYKVRSSLTSSVLIDKFFESYSNYVTKFNSTGRGNRVAMKNSESKEIENIKIYPNPVSSILSISGIVNNLEYKIYNSLGQEMTLVPLISMDNLINLDVSDLTNGIYYFNFMNGTESVTQKFIKI